MVVRGEGMSSNGLRSPLSLTGCQHFTTPNAGWIRTKKRNPIRVSLPLMAPFETARLTLRLGSWGTRHSAIKTIQVGQVHRVWSDGEVPGRRVGGIRPFGLAE